MAITNIDWQEQNDLDRIHAIKEAMMNNVAQQSQTAAAVAGNALGGMNSYNHGQIFQPKYPDPSVHYIGEDLGSFKIYKVTNGFVVSWLGDYPPKGETHVCSDANDIPGVIMGILTAKRLSK